MSIKSLVKNALIAVENRKYQKALAARRMSYARWQGMQADVQEGASFSLENYVVLQSCQGTPVKGWQKRLSAYLAQHPKTLVVYGDEDVEMSPGVYDMPYFKPDWSPDLLEQWFYPGGLVAIHRSLADKMENCPGNDPLPMGPEVMEGLVNKAVQLAGGYEKGARDLIGHVPAVLFHRNIPWPKSGTGEGERVPGKINKERLLSIIIPSKDHPGLLDTCLGAVQHLEQELAYEIIVVDNGSSEENRQKCQEIFGRYQTQGMAVTYLYEPMEFNFSRMCNLGARKAQGDLFLFLNDDVELACENTLAAMARRALRPYTGAVGLKLYYPGGKRIQHCGITNLPMGPVHKLQFLEDDKGYYMDSNFRNRNVLAVTAACLMVTKEKFWEAGGFWEELQVAFNDVALCFSLYELGYYNLIWNEQYAYHHESLSRGDDEADHKLRRLLQERQMLYGRHPSLEGRDPYYPEGLGREGLDTRIRPAYETGANRPQSVIKSGQEMDLKNYRLDPCLMLRVEMSTREQLLGYGVVLGDDNSCYEKTLLLIEKGEACREAGGDSRNWQQGAIKGELQAYAIPVEGQYRPDLIENMPDQKNVGLCGFWLQIPRESKGIDSGIKSRVWKPSPGIYGVGMLARNRVNGTKLIQFSNREWKIEAE